MVNIENIGVFVWALSVMGLVTCGFVLLVNLLFERLSFANRVLAVVVASPVLTFGPVFLFADTNVAGDWWAAVIGIVFVLFFFGLIFSWPITHIATRRLDRIKQNATSVFE